jgi:hypothetical protein
VPKDKLKLSLTVEIAENPNFVIDFLPKFRQILKFQEKPLTNQQKRQSAKTVELKVNQ